MKIFIKQFSQIVFITLFCAKISAQVVIEEVSKNSAEIATFDEKELIENQYVSLLINNGSHNIVNLEQIGINAVEARIQGSRNLLEISQSGIQNFNSTLQLGHFNDIRANIDGTANDVKYIQIGNHNVINQTLDLVTNANYLIEQNGSNLELNHNLNNVSNDAFIIKMEGVGMQITIETKN